jgi:putative nucleotidyltransferase with HDIG domain
MIKKIQSNDLQIGMYVARLDRAWIETPFIVHRFQIKEQRQLDQLNEYCRFVFIDTGRGLEGSAVGAVEAANEQILEELRSPERLESEIGAGSVGTNTPLRFKAGPEAEGMTPLGTGPASVGAEIQRAIKIQEQAKRTASRILSEVRMGMSVPTSEARETVSHVVDSVARNSSALVCLSQLRGRDEYTSRHSINVCALSVAFGRFLGLKKDRLQDLGMGGLLHDIGKTKVSMAVLNKPGKLTAPEFDQIKRHVEFGLEVLAQSKGVPSASLEVVAEHHERSNGTGYPARLDAPKIGLFGAIAAIVDVYDAITTDRIYHAHMTPHDAIRSMFQWGDRDFKMELLERFIRFMGIYPAGSVVQINHAQIAVVMEANPAQPLKPSILIILDENRREYPFPKMIDLATEGMDKLTITDVLDPVEERINVKAIVSGAFTS